MDRETLQSELEKLVDGEVLVTDDAECWDIRIAWDMGHSELVGSKRVSVEAVESVRFDASILAKLLVVDFIGFRDKHLSPKYADEDVRPGLRR